MTMIKQEAIALISEAMCDEIFFLGDTLMQECTEGWFVRSVCEKSVQRYLCYTDTVAIAICVCR